MDSIKPKVSYIEKIDIIRFVAAMMVVVYHGYDRWVSIWGYNNFMVSSEDPNTLNAAGKWIHGGISNGGFGVDIFFLISGFLITLLLLKEREAFGKIDIPKFYIRRALRIWPLYYLTIAVAPLLISWLDKTGQPNYLANILFYNNFDTASTHFWIYPLAHMWSLCVEEHFYLFWPFVIAFVPVKKLFNVMIFIICASICYRAYVILNTTEPWYTLFLSSFSRIDVLAIGGMAGYLHWKKPITLTVSVGARLMIYAVFIIVFCNDQVYSMDNLYLACAKKYFYIAVAGFAMLNFLFNEKPIMNWANNSLLRYFGKVSYGIYVIGLIVLDVIVEKIMNEIGSSNLYLYWTLVLVFSLAIPVLSYELYEKWFLKFKKRFELLAIEQKGNTGSSDIKQ